MKQKRRHSFVLTMSNETFEEWTDSAIREWIDMESKKSYQTVMLSFRYKKKPTAEMIEKISDDVFMRKTENKI